MKLEPFVIFYTPKQTTKLDVEVEGKEIPTCKYCKYRYEHDDGASECEKMPGWFPVTDDWFCADGFKKDDN